MRRWWLITALLVGSGIMAWLAGCTSGPKELRFRSEYEAGVGEKVRQALIDFSNAYNLHNVEGIVLLFSENGQIVSEGKTGVFPREQFFRVHFPEAFKEAFKKYPSMKLGRPYAFIVLPSRDKAVMEAVAAFGDIELRMKASMRLEGDQWLIVKILFWN
ncbi:MAG: hypothetical protein C4576_21250 [Desulfobacteraceae bacterium]|nr:MAG: hypothetical protein C4576_21250 [Desulfobacteraceae bacterium]